MNLTHPISILRERLDFIEKLLISEKYPPNAHMKEILEDKKRQVESAIEILKKNESKF